MKTGKPTISGLLDTAFHVYYVGCRCCRLL